MINIATKNFNRTPRMLVEKLKENGYPAQVISECDAGKDNQFYVCWGVNPRFDNGKILNKGSIFKRSEVFKALMLDKIPVPEFTTLDSSFINGLKNCLLRDEYGFGGRDISNVIESDSIDEIPSGKVLVEYINKIAEYRVNFAGYDVLITRKIHEDDGLSYKSVSRNDIAWNHAFGYKQISVSNKFLEYILKNIANAVKDALVVDFGAIDVVVDLYGRPYVLEYNSAPGLTVDNRISLYIDYIIKEYNRYKDYIRI